MDPFSRGPQPSLPRPFLGSPSTEPGCPVPLHTSQGTRCSSWAPPCPSRPARRGHGRPAHLPGGTSLRPACAGSLRTRRDQDAPRRGGRAVAPSKLVLAQPPPPAGCLSLQLLSPGVCLPTRLIWAPSGGGLELAVGDTASRTRAGSMGQKKGKGPPGTPTPVRWAQLNQAVPAPPPPTRCAHSLHNSAPTRPQMELQAATVNSLRNVFLETQSLLEASTSLSLS